jgi:Thoeris protein ThsB, TIR-like domain
VSSVTQRNPIRLFVCHIWRPDEDYHRVFEYLESANNFFYTNTSTPDQRPQGDREALREDLRKQIGNAEVVILTSSLYRRNIDWIEFQLHCAKAFDKPVVVLEPFGAKDTIAPAVQEIADEVVPWDQRQLVDAVKRQARHEETTRFDVIEFKLD